MQGDSCGTPSNDNINDYNKSLPVPGLKGDYRDGRNHSDEDAMIVNDAETEAEANTKSNTTVTKSIAMLNATIMASVWSLADQIPRTIVTASVVAFL